MKKFLSLIFSFIFIIFLYLFTKLNFQCLILKIFKIKCPSCGMTRAFISIFNLDFISAIKYNLLSIPLFIFIVYSFYNIIKDILNKKNTYLNKILNYLSKYYKIIIIILIINTIINNIGL